MNEIQSRKHIRIGGIAIFLVAGILLMPELERLNATAYTIFTLLYYSVFQVCLIRLAWSDLTQVQHRERNIPIIATGWTCGLVVLPVTVITIFFSEESTTFRTLLMSVSGVLAFTSMLLFVVGGRSGWKSPE